MAACTACGSSTISTGADSGLTGSTAETQVAVSNPLGTAAGSKSNAADTRAPSEASVAPVTDTALSTTSSFDYTTTANLGVGTIVPDVFVDRAIIEFLNDISLPKTAADTFGGVVSDTANDRAVVYFSSALTFAAAQRELRQAIDQANAWLNQSVVDENGNPVITTVAPMTPVVLVPSELTYRDFAMITQQLADQYLRANRLVSTTTNYALRRVEIGVTDVTPADIAAVHEEFAERAVLVDSGPID